MAEITVSTHVAAELNQVFQAYTDLEKAVDRIPSIVSTELLTEGPFGNGTRWRETRMMFKKEATEEMWVTGFDPPKGYTVEAASHGMRYSTRFSFVPDDGGTTVTWAFTSTAQSFGAKVMAPVFNLLLGGTMKKCMLQDLEAIRDSIQQA